ncbi:MAG: hypothetical protein HRU41_39610 [Saprospiraceae bacterium]|nr:hypothetical protein [Saprospiraceae bacterium]
MDRTFKEVQRFTQWWLWALLIGITLIPIYGVIQQIGFGQSFGDNPMSNIGLLLFLVLMLAFDYGFWMLRLITEMDETTIKINFFPLVKREIRWSEVKTYQIVDYGFVGGWGIRMGTKYGTVYNTRGKTGLALTLLNGTRYCIGTQKEGELADFLKDIEPSITT